MDTITLENNCLIQETTIMTSIKTYAIMCAVAACLAALPGATAFWNQAPLIQETSNARNLRADFTCRVHNYLRANPNLQKAGVDGWLTYTAEGALGMDKVFVKNYQFNNKYPRDETWYSDLELPFGTAYSAWGQNVKGFYFSDPVNLGSHVPAAYVSYIRSDNRIAVSLVKFDQGKIILDTDIVIAPDLSVDTNSKSQVLIAGTNFHVLWDEPSSDMEYRVLYIAPVVVKTVPTETGSAYQYVTGNKTMLCYIPDASEGMDYQATIYPVIENKVYHGAVVWSAESLGTGDHVIRALGFKYVKDGNIWDFEASQQQALVSPENAILKERPRIVVSPTLQDRNDNVLMMISWFANNTPFQSHVVMRAVQFSEQSAGWLERATDFQHIPVDNALPCYAIAADRGLVRPQSIAYHSETGRLAVAQMANHRITIIDDPFPESQGVWIAELRTKPFLDTGAVTRITEQSGYPPVPEVLQIRQTIQLALPWEGDSGGVPIVGVNFHGQHFPELMNDTSYPVGTTSLGSSLYDAVLEDMELVSDDFSSFYCFFIRNTAETQYIHWVSDGLLLRDNGDRDRLTHPYDLEFIPPVWTPTPTPTGSETQTPLPTWTPRPDGIWVADMAGHRVVRLNAHGEIMAETLTLSPVNPAVWSEYEHFAVISPNAVSAAYDGSCWAIDWGRNRVVKIAPDGTVTAFTEPCDSVDPEACFTALKMIHPLALDCGGDPNTCFVADYEGNRIYKLTLLGNTIITDASQAQYYRPKAVKVSRQLEFGQVRENIWVADRWSYEATPSGSYTFTPVPVATRTPTPGPGTPTAVPYTPTPFPERQRVSMNLFGDLEFFPVIPSSIPISLSVVSNSDNDMYCYIADRDAGWSGMGKNFVRWIKVIGGSYEEIKIGFEDGRTIHRPVDVEAVGAPPTRTPTP
jgi:hypothetical protein